MAQHVVYPGECSMGIWEECVFCCCLVVAVCWVYLVYGDVHFNLQWLILNCLFLPSFLSKFATHFDAVIKYKNVLNCYGFWWIDPFIIIKCPFISQVTLFILKFIWSDIIIAIQAYLWVLFAWYIFFHLSTFNLFASLKCISCRQHRVGSFFFLIQCNNLCLIFGLFNPFIFYITINILGFSSDICLLFVSMCLMSFVFLCFSLIAFFCITWIFSNIVF